MTKLDASATNGIVGYRLRRAQIAVFQQFLAEFEALGLRPAEYSTLMMVRDNPGRKQAEIALALGIKRANFVALVDGLRRRGVLDRQAKDGDRRSHALFLTEAGQALAKDAEAVQAALEGRLVARLGGVKARDRLLGLLDKITD